MHQTTDTGLDLAAWLGGAAAGAALMYMLDPAHGGARRAHAAEAMRHLRARTAHAVGRTWHGGGVHIRASAGAHASFALDTAPTRHALERPAEAMVDAPRRGWTPALRHAALAGAGLLTLYGLGRRSAPGWRLQCRSP